MDADDRDKELTYIIDSLSKRLEFLDYAGVRDLPASSWTPPAAVPEVPSAPRHAPAPRKAAVEAPAPVPTEGIAPVALFIWRLSGVVAFVGGVSGSLPPRGLPASQIAQLERLAAWMAGELGIKEGFSANGAWSGAYPAIDAASRAVAEELGKAPPRMVVTLGPVAAGVMLGNADLSSLRGRFHDAGGSSAVATHGLGDMLKSPALKKEAHSDLLMALGRLK